MVVPVFVIQLIDLLYPHTGQIRKPKTIVPKT